MRLLFKLPASAAAVLVVGVLAFIGINAWDDPLSPAAQRLLTPPPLGKLDRDNGWVAGIGFHAPAGETAFAWGALRLEWMQARDQKTVTVRSDPGKEVPLAGSRENWFRLKESPLEAARAKRDELSKLLAENETFIRRYQLIRAAPRYEESFWPAGPTASVPFDNSIIAGSRLAIAGIALSALDGRLEDTVLELEKEVAHHRRQLASTRTLLARLMASVALAHDMAMLSDLVRAYGPKLAPYGPRLAVLVAPLSADEVDLVPVIAFEGWVQANALLRYRDAILHENNAINEFWVMSGQPRIARWEAFGYRTHQTVNEFAEWHARQVEETRARYARIRSGKTAAQADTPDPPQEPRPAWRLVNPTGSLLRGGLAYGFGSYFMRMADTAAWVGLVNLQLDAAMDASRHEALTKQLMADGAVALRDPFNSTARFDFKSSQLRYKPQSDASWSKELASRGEGHFAVPFVLRGGFAR